ncbi:hypothetical protein SAMN05216228_101376 [Rhizobium tibeticum]|uniref:Uncharacterized protein n=1 Tax=Rhizobium tibeticum TaxID=501024 RepID=A0A1H8MUK9_9HYPH|nr:hypothetical protein [Rhizobium tibeticum]SEI11418.1 hypothetical protein RTCCBAU85039_4666 [Rhizobium tibeticum]SEO21092.1 hypothetical protein SAMN05216228_101376 [Rhizobium tibeticum]
MEDPRFNSFRYGLAVLLMRHPHLRVYAHTAHWWIEDIENYGDAVRFRELRAEGGNKRLLEEYEQICIQLEEEVLSYFGTSDHDRS